MPGAPRPHGSAKKVAYRILGQPQNMKKNKQQNSKVNKRLIFEETVRVR